MEKKNIKMLDEVLNYLYENRNLKHGDNGFKQYFEPQSIFKGLKEKGIILEIDDVIDCAEKLCEDKYANYKTDMLNVDKGMRVYGITFNGKLLKESGGYKKKFFRDKTKNIARILNIVILAGAAIIASIYYCENRILESKSNTQHTWQCNCTK
jgi:hypothetical protein